MLSTTQSTTKNTAKTTTQKALCLLLLPTLVSSQLGMSAYALEWPKPAPNQAHTTQDITPQIPHNQPNFEAPSATDCKQAIATREIPGRSAAQQHSYGGDTPLTRRDRTESTPRVETDSGAPLAAALPAPAPAALPAPTPAHIPAPKAARAEVVGKTSEDTSSYAFAGKEVGRDSAARDSVASEVAQRPAQPVTVGMVDDNAAFSEYLAFRNRTQVQHQERDVSERYLLEVNDGSGHAIADAEVAVASSSGYSTWLRTDAAGKAWIHPNAFDPARSQFYEVTARQGTYQASAVLQRGQKSAVEVQLAHAVLAQKAKLDLVFLIDATGSMDDEIDKLKTSLRSITAEVAALPSHPDLCLGLVAYRDKGDEFLVRTHDLTNDVSAFQKVLNALQANGGGDYPEAMNEALFEAVHHIHWRGDHTTRMVVLLADAPPHLDYAGPQYDNEMLAALGKGIKIMSVGASGLDSQGEYIQRQLAQYTGGRFIFLTYADATNPSSGPGRETVHDVRNYSVQTLDKLIVRLVREELDQLPKG